MPQSSSNFSMGLKANPSQVSSFATPSYTPSSSSSSSGLFDYNSLIKEQLKDTARKNALTELREKGVTDLTTFDPLKMPAGLSLETQDWARNNLTQPGFFQKNAGVISAGADVLGGLAALYGTYKMGQLQDTQRKMAENELAFNKERQANFRASRSGFNAAASQPKSAFVGS